ncbi:MAG TPA: TerC family protein [Steroidobacteraceae bacterium]|nr:TerC family protein [Steroidobacteraceae bacterium]
MLAAWTEPDSLLALLTLTVLEIVLGIDNVIFLSVLVARLPAAQQLRARVLGLGLAMLTRVALLCSIVWLTGLTQPWFELAGHPVSGRELILGVGGLFLLGSSVLEMHRTVEDAAPAQRARTLAGIAAIVIQIGLIDIVFSLDSVFTAIGLARPDQLPIMITAIVIAILVMMWLSGHVARFVDRHPTIRVLALSFLILIGMALLAEAMRVSIPKGYLYFAMAFSVAVELLNLRLRARR